MSRTYEIYIDLTTTGAVPEDEQSFWKKILATAVDDPESLMTLEVNVVDDETIDTHNVRVRDTFDGGTSFTVSMYQQVNVFYGLDRFLRDIEQAIYQATKPLKRTFYLACRATDQDPDPSAYQESTYDELRAKYESLQAAC